MARNAWNESAKDVPFGGFVKKLPTPTKPKFHFSNSQLNMIEFQ